MFSVEAVLEERYPRWAENKPVWYNPLVHFLRILFHENDFHSFAARYPHLQGFDFVEQVLDYFQFGFKVLDYERERIPSHGRVVIISNHPIGSLDGLALLKMVGEIRRDIKVVANDMLNSVPPLRSLLLPVDNMNCNTARGQLKAIREHLNGDGAVIIFPAGEVSRFGPTGIKDGKWFSGFLRFAQATNSPILPIHIDGRNSVVFYAMSALSKPLSTLLLVREMFKQSKNYIEVRVGNVIPPEQYVDIELGLPQKAKLFKKHVYRLGKGKTHRRFLLGDVSQALAHPENRQLIKKEIQGCELLGETYDGKKIYLYQHQYDSVLMREIGRLREMTFRAVNEGTGLRRDTDPYDQYYDHLVLWDEDALEVVGSYRLVIARRALNQTENYPALYTQTLFDYSTSAEDIFDQGIELGRSFVQPNYWGKRSLDYLWYGIGAYLRKHPEVRYLFGPVSISDSYPSSAKDLLVSFYSMYFSDPKQMVEAKNPYCYSGPQVFSLTDMFSGENYQEDFIALKQALAELGVTVPTLYKQYTEVVDEGGVCFSAFNVDSDFSDCIDGLCVVDLHRLKASRRKRYIGE